MKTYIGTKQVKAEPMNELAAVEKGYARKNEDNHEWREGYHVQYTNPDGSTYDSWSPKSVFEQAYKCADSFIDRLQIEHDELKERYNKLDNFLESGKAEKVCEENQIWLMALQRINMQNYLGNLATRLKFLKDAPSQTAGLTCSTSYVGEVFTATPRSGAYTSPTMRIQSTTHKYRGCAGSFTSTFNSSSHDGLNVPLNLKPSFINNPISLHYD